MNFFKTKYLIRKRALGDVLWIEPVIRQLSTRYSKLVVNTKFNVLFKNYPLDNVEFIDDLPIFHKINLRIHRLLNLRNLYIDLDNAYEAKPELHMLHAYQEQAKVHKTNEYPEMHWHGVEISAGTLPDKYVILHLETLSMRNYRNVYGIEWEKIIRYFDNCGLAVIQIGVKPDLIPGATFIKTTIPEMINLIYNCELFIGIDSGPSHIAASFKKKSILFFGAINPWLRHFKELFNGIIMQGYCEFQHCYHKSIGTNGPVCCLVGTEGIPKCSLHDTDILLKNIKAITVDQTNF